MLCIKYVHFCLGWQTSVCNENDYTSTLTQDEKKNRYTMHWQWSNIWLQNKRTRERVCIACHRWPSNLEAYEVLNYRQNGDILCNLGSYTIRPLSGTSSFVKWHSAVHELFCLQWRLHFCQWVSCQRKQMHGNCFRITMALCHLTAGPYYSHKQTTSPIICMILFWT